MTMKFDAQFEELVLAVTCCDYEGVKSILSSEWYEKNTVKIMHWGRNIGFTEKKLSIHDIPRFWMPIVNADNEALLADDCYKKELAILRKDNEKIKAYRSFCRMILSTYTSMGQIAG